MKKIISTVLSITLLLGVMQVAMAAVPKENEAYVAAYSHDFSKKSYTGLVYKSGDIYPDEGVAKFAINATDADGKMGTENFFRFANNQENIKIMQSNKWKIEADVTAETLIRFQFGAWLTNSSGTASDWLVPGTFHHDGKFYNLAGEATYTAYEANKPMHLEVFYDNTTGAFAMYVDGTKVSEGTQEKSIGSGGIWCGSIALTTSNQPKNLEAGSFVKVDNAAISNYSDFSCGYKDDAGYNKVIFEDKFENGVSAESWYMPAAGGNGTTGAYNNQTSSNAAFLTGKYPRMHMSYQTDGKKEVSEKYSANELKRVRIKMDMLYAYTGTTTSQLTVEAYNAATGKNMVLFKFNNNNPIWHPFGLSNTSSYNFTDVGAGQKNTNYTMTVYIDMENHKGTIKVGDKTLIEDYDLTTVENYDANNPRIDAILITQGDVPESGTYIDNFSYTVQAPEIKVEERGNTAGTVNYTYCPDLLKGGDNACLIVAVKNGGVVSKIIPAYLTAEKLTAADITGEGTYKPKDAYITARKTITASVPYTKAADETIEVYLWEGSTMDATMKPLVKAVK